MKITVFISIVIGFLIFNSLSCNTTEPPEDNLQPGRRDYTWTADTIKIVNNGLTLIRMWGITPTNVWVLGTSTSSFLSIWHYDGSRWDCDSVQRNIDPWAIIGFSNDDVWMGNANSTIWKYNGSQWQKYATLTINDYDRVLIQGFDGVAENSIFAIGGADQYNNSKNYIGLIMQYDGTGWKISNTGPFQVGFNECAIDNKSGNLIIEGTDYAAKGGWVEKVYSWDGKKLNELYSGSTYAPIGSIKHQAYVYINKKLSKYENGRLVLWKDMTNTDCASKIWCGRNENDFFMRSSTGIGHYNGTDFKTIYKIYGDTDITGGCIFEKDVFFSLHNYQTGVNVFVHGKLN